jgi:hypothetical protein
VFNRNSLQIVVLDDKKEEKKKTIKEEAIKREERKYIVTPAQFIALIYLITY